jgi:hypothetical protein
MRPSLVLLHGCSLLAPTHASRRTSVHTILAAEPNEILVPLPDEEESIRGV